METMADLAAMANDKLVEGFINEIRTDSYIIDTMPFDNCVNASGTSNLSYSYDRVETGASAAFRALGSEPAVSELKVKKITTHPGILSNSWKMDRVVKDALPSYLELKITESKNAIIRGFNNALINGDTSADANGFDGLSKALKGSSTEFTSAIDWTNLDKTAALAFATEMDTMLGEMTRDADVILVNAAMNAKINAAARQLGIDTVTMDTAGHRVKAWDGIRIEVLRDGAIKDNSIYAVCLGASDFHGITLAGGNGITVSVPDWAQPGAIKTGDAEFVCGCALKATKSAAVLRPATEG
jgi:hypothetical protein